MHESEVCTALLQEVEAFYKALYQAEGHDITPPSSYPQGALLGAVQVVACLQAGYCAPNPTARCLIQHKYTYRSTEAAHCRLAACRMRRCWLGTDCPTP